MLRVQLQCGLKYLTLKLHGSRGDNKVRRLGAVTDPLYQDVHLTNVNWLWH